MGPPGVDDLHEFRPVSDDQVLQLLKSLDTRKAVGPDELPASILKTHADTLTPSLTKIFNASLSTGSLPNEFNCANVCPVFKAGDPKDPRNYRPISLLPILSKVLEKIVHEQLTEYITEIDALIASATVCLSKKLFHRRCLDFGHRSLVSSTRSSPTNWCCFP